MPTRELAELLEKILNFVVLFGVFVFAVHLLTREIIKLELPGCVRAFAYCCHASFWLAEVCRNPTSAANWFCLLLVPVLAWGEKWPFDFEEEEDE